ncbi:MAG: GNAT family N-acetyltransferase [Clostridia bacterium]|nr:GNAT family N-acetyltransferase [Clostridia bacterium]
MNENSKIFKEFVGPQGQKRVVKAVPESDLDAYLDCYLNAYPQGKSQGDDGREKYGPRIINSMRNDKGINFYGLYEEGKIIATMKLIDFDINLFGEMRKSVGVMALAVHPLHKKKGAAKNMIEFSEYYAKASGAILNMLLPFRIDFYKSMGYGYGTKINEYTLDTASLPKHDYSHLRFVDIHKEYDALIQCYKDYVHSYHGMVYKFEDELRDIDGDSDTRRFGYYDENGQMKGYVAFDFEADSDENYTINYMNVKELVYSDKEVLAELLGGLQAQADLAQRLVIRSGEADFTYVFPNCQSTNRGYIDFGFMETNLQAVGTMYKISDLKAFVQGTEHRKFLTHDRKLKFVIYDEFKHREFEQAVEFKNGHWYPCDAADEYVKGNLSDISALLMGSCDFGALARLGVLETNGDEDIMDALFHVSQKPFTNTDY